VVINLGSGGDTFTINALGAAFDATVTVNGGSGADTVIVNALSGAKAYTLNGAAGNDSFTLGDIAGDDADSQWRVAGTGHSDGPSPRFLALPITLTGHDLVGGRAAGDAERNSEQSRNRKYHRAERRIYRL
jgi:Ca2+-binding RTX toxin-like protein